MVSSIGLGSDQGSKRHGMWMRMWRQAHPSGGKISNSRQLAMVRTVMLCLGKEAQNIILALKSVLRLAKSRMNHASRANAASKADNVDEDVAHFPQPARGGSGLRAAPRPQG